MATSKAQIRAVNKYNADHVRRYCLSMNLKTDADVIKKLAEVESINGYIKRLVREDISKR